jgi:hypothetical protein
MQDLITKNKNQVPSPLHKSVLDQEHKCTSQREISPQDELLRMSYLVSIYIFLECLVRSSSQPRVFVLFFYFPFFYFFFFLFFVLAPQSRLFVMALGFLVLLMAWCPSQGVLCNSAGVLFLSFDLFMVNLSSRIFI